MKVSKLMFVLCTGVVCFGCGNLVAAPNVTIDNVVQRWPWNNKVDITYTINDGQNVTNGTFYRLVFTATIKDVDYTIDGVTNVGASANTGTHTVTWTAPTGIKPTAFSMVASLYAAENPSGDDYMIVNLDTGAVSYEGLLASQALSDARYNQTSYKTENMVLRKVAAGGTYPTGDDVYLYNVNRTRDWTTDKDYYIGIFMVTQSQWKKLCGNNPSTWKAEKAGNDYNLRPVDKVSKSEVRGDISPAEVPGSDPNGSFMERLNAITGMGGFDLPTEVMFEIAERAGATNTFSWGNDIDINYIVCHENVTDDTSQEVGSRNANAWGLFDTSGNLWEWVRDDGSLANLYSAADPWTPASSGSDVRIRGGDAWYNDATADLTYKNTFRASSRVTRGTGNGHMSVGFRVARIMQ